jgi:hypothetical protein
VGGLAWFSERKVTETVEKPIVNRKAIKFPSIHNYLNLRTEQFLSTISNTSVLEVSSGSLHSLHKQGYANAIFALAMEITIELLLHKPFSCVSSEPRDLN